MQGSAGPASEAYASVGRTLEPPVRETQKPRLVASDPFAPARTLIVRRVAIGALVLDMGLILTLSFRDSGFVDLPLYLLIALGAGLLLALSERAPRLAGFVAVSGFMVAVTWAAWHREGLASGTSSGAFALGILVAALTWSQWGAYAAAAMGSACVAVLAWWSPHPVAVPWRNWTEVTAILITLAVFVQQALQTLGSHVLAAVQSERRFEGLLRSSPQGVVWLAPNRRVLLANPVARELLEAGGSTAEGESLEHLTWLEPDSQREFLKRLPDALDKPAEERLELLSLGGRSLQVRLTPLHSVPSQDGCLMTVVDISERVEAERAKESYQRRIQRSKSLEALGRLAGGVAHDFNNMLTIILATTEVLRRTRPEPAELEEHVDQIEGASRRASALTRQLLAFGRRQVLEPRVLCPNEVIEQLRPLLERLLPSSVDTRIQCASDLGNVRVDATRLEQVIVNLTTNAAQAMPDGGELTLGTRNLDVETVPSDAEHAPGPYVELWVTDTGHGMSEATLARIFEPFFTSGSDGGTGLGLATAHGIVAQSGGHIVVDSQIGEGTCFRVRFPRVTELSTRTPARTPNRCTPRRLQVLLVEDEPNVRRALAQMLRSLGHEVVSCADGEAGLCAFGESGGVFDLVITDLVMPKMTGTTLAAELRRRAPDLKLLFVSGFAPNPLMQQGNWGHEALFLAKPPSVAELSDKLDALFAQVSCRPLS